MAIYLIRAYPKNEKTRPLPSDLAYWMHHLDKELKEGRARFGWSTNGLPALSRKLENNEQLTADEKRDWDKAGFILGINKDDYLVYLRFPNWDAQDVSVARATKSKGYKHDEKWDPEGKYPDEEYNFRHIIPCAFLGKYLKDDFKSKCPTLWKKREFHQPHLEINDSEEDYPKALKELEELLSRSS